MAKKIAECLCRQSSVGDDKLLLTGSLGGGRAFMSANLVHPTRKKRRNPAGGGSVLLWSWLVGWLLRVGVVVAAVVLGEDLGGYRAVEAVLEGDGFPLLVTLHQVMVNSIVLP